MNITEAKRRNRWHYLLYRVAMFMVTLMIGVLIVFFASYNLEESPLIYTNEPFPMPDVLSPGDEFIFTLERCADYQVNYSWTEEYVHQGSGKIYAQPGSFATAQPGCTSIEAVPKHVPTYVDEGYYRIFFLVIAEGRFKDHEMTLRTEPFYITN